MRISFQQVRVRPPRPGQPSGTDEIWDKTGTAAGPGFELARLKRGEITFVFKKDGQEVFVYNASVYRNYDWGPQTYYDMESNFDAQVYIDGTGWVGREYYDYTYWDDDSYLVNIYLENAEQYQENLMRLDFSEMAGTGSKPNVTVYQGAYQDRETLQAAIASGEAKEVTSEVWGSEAPGIKGNFCYTNQNQAPRFTLLIQQGNIPDSDWGGDDGQDIVLSISARIVNPEFSLMGPIDVCYGEDRIYVCDDVDFTSSEDGLIQKRIVTLRPGFPADGTYYVRLVALANGEFPFFSGDDAGALKHVEKAVVGSCTTADEVLDANKLDIKSKLFASAYTTDGGYGADYTDYSKGVTFTVLDIYGRLHRVTVQLVASAAVASRPNPLSDDTYFHVDGANQSASGSPYKAYLMKYSDDSYYYNGYQTVFLLNDDGSAVSAETIYPIFWTGSKVNVYAAHNTASGEKVESKKSPVQVTFGQPIQYSAGSESGTHLKNYWVTFVTQTANGANLFVNGATNSAHKDIESGLPVREVFLTAGYGYRHDIFFANIGDAQMTGLSVTLSDDAQNIALDDYWKIGSTTTLAPFTTTESKDSEGEDTTYGELPNVSKIRLVPKKNADGTLASGEISGTLTISYTGGDPVVIKLTGTAAKPKITTGSIKPGVKYVHYSSVIQTDNMYNADGVEFKIATGTLPNGIILKPNGELYGVPTVTGEYKFTVQADYNGAKSDTKEFTLTIEDNTHENVWNATDSAYEVITAIPNEDGTLTINAMNKGDNSFTSSTQLFVTEGEYPYFVELKLDGKLLEEGTDYTKEPGSTRITLQTQTLKNAGSGTTHTLSAEFREGDTMKRAAQNYEIEPKQSSGGATGGYPSGGNTSTGTGTGNSGGQTPAKPTMPFVDVPEAAWYYSEVAWAYENGFMVGVSGTKFEPNISIDQATVVTVLARMAKVDLNQFSAEGYDNITSGRWYSSAAVWATQAGLLPDYTEFIETGAISRGNMAIMLVKYLHSMGFDTSLPSPMAEFADADLMTQDEFYAFQVLYHYGIFRGIGGMRMNPIGITSRCEFSTLIHRLHTLLEK